MLIKNYMKCLWPYHGTILERLRDFKEIIDVDSAIDIFVPSVKILPVAIRAGGGKGEAQTVVLISLAMDIFI
jgi:hypothetical protein